MLSTGIFRGFVVLLVSGETGTFLESDPQTRTAVSGPRGEGRRVPGVSLDSLLGMPPRFIGVPCLPVLDDTGNRQSPSD